VLCVVPVGVQVYMQSSSGCRNVGMMIVEELMTPLTRSSSFFLFRVKKQIFFRGPFAEEKKVMCRF